LITATKLEQNKKQAWEYLSKIIGTRYTWWKSGIVPERGPAWGKNGPPPSPAEVKKEGCFCAGVGNLARRAVDLPIPTLGNANYDGGVVAYFGSTNAAPPTFARRGYFDVHGRERRFDLKAARRPWTLIGRKFRNANDQGHVAIVLPSGKLLQSYDSGGGRPGVNTGATLEASHYSWGPGGGYEVMVFAEDWLLPFDHKEPRGEDHKEPRDEGHKEPRDGHKRPRDGHEEHRVEHDDHQKDREKRPDGDREEQRPEEAPLFTARQLFEMAENPNLEQATVEKYRDALIPEMREAGVTTPLRMSAFFGNVMVETARLSTLEEFGTESYFRYGPPGGDGEYLGDQWRYHGRGFLMNTWKSAYANLSRVLDVDLVSNPDLLEQPKLAAKAAMWFWTQHDLNSYADRGNFRAVASIINTGRADSTPNHWEERLHSYDVAKRVLASGPGGARSRESGEGFNSDGLPHINIAAVGQADETAAFVLATEIRRAGIGVSVTNGAASVYALAKKIRPERLGNRQLWILGEPALDACGEYAELANWPANPKTDYYNLAGKDFTGSCRRAAELADEKAKRGVGRRFLEEIGAENTSYAKSPPPKAAPPQDEPQVQRTHREQEEDGHHESRPEEQAREKDDYRDHPETSIDARPESRKDWDGENSKDSIDDRDNRPDAPEPAEEFTEEELEKIGREIVDLFSRIRRSRTPRRESEAYMQKEEH
jgi:putative chitinase